MTKPFSLPFKQKMIERLTGANAASARKLARETGIRQQTLSRWLSEARSLSDVPSKKRQAKAWSIDEKIRVLAKSAKLTGEELTEYLDQEGLLLAELEQWRMALGDETSAAIATTKRMRKLERELARKEKALAEDPTVRAKRRGSARKRREGRDARRLKATRGFGFGKRR
jgi:hypothetical protein